MEIKEYKPKKIDNEKLIIILEEKFKSKAIDSKFWLNFSQIYCEVHSSAMKDTIKLLKNDDDLKFDYIKCITGLDYTDHLEVVYSLYSFDNNYTINIKVRLESNNSERSGNVEIDSITDIFLSADWFEREIWEFFGINFKGHPNLKTFLLPGDVDYHPLLKSFSIKWEEREYERPKVFE